MKEFTDDRLEELWLKLGDIPINKGEEIEEPFLHFCKGTDMYDIWHWFDYNHTKGLVYIQHGIIAKNNTN
jgi:hypothetical protein